MSLETLWFILIMVLFGGYFYLEGFDFGVGMLLPILGKDDRKRRMLIASIGPVWDANEVWLLTAGGAMFAAFPGWYATMFSGFYLALFLILFALIYRGVAFEFRGKVEHSRWRSAWDAGIVLGSLLPPLLVGVALANLIHGVPIDAKGHFTGSLLTLLNLPCLLAGVATLAVCVYHGAVFLSLRQSGELQQEAQRIARIAGAVALGLGVLVFALAAFTTDAFAQPLSLALGIVSIVALAASWLMVWRGRSGFAMGLNAAAILGAVGSLFAGLFPRVMVSSTNAAYSLTVQNASSSPYTLQVMTLVALTVLPIVLAYSAWTYWVFRKKVQARDLEY